MTAGVPAGPVRWAASELTTAQYDAESDTYVQPGVFLTARGDEHDDVRAVLRVEFAVTPDGAEISPELAGQLSHVLNAWAVIPGELS